jgi:hypothetical protein
MAFFEKNEDYLKISKMSLIFKILKSIKKKKNLKFKFSKNFNNSIISNSKYKKFQKISK